MEKLVRIYNQNRGKIFVLIIVIIFIFVIISLFNLRAKDENKDQSEKVEAEVSNTEKNKYYNESKSMVTGGNVSDSVKNKFGDLVDTFLDYCKNHEPEKAYGLLSDDCKEILYPTEWLFEQQYYNSKFSDSKRYSFQSWTASDTYIYQVKIFDDMLATGKGSSQKYIQDYFSVVKQGDEDYRLNINGFVGKVNMNETISKDNVTITVKDRSAYMDYSVYTVNLKNDGSNTLLLDSRESANTTYIEDANNIKFGALLYENNSDDFYVKPGEQKDIKIKFSDSYREKISINKMVFSDIYLDGTNKTHVEVNFKD